MTRQKAKCTQHSGFLRMRALQFYEKGYLALPGFATVEQCEALKTRIRELIDKDFDPQAIRSIFSTTNQVLVRQRHQPVQQHQQHVEQWQCQGTCYTAKGQRAHCAHSTVKVFRAVASLTCVPAGGGQLLPGLSQQQ